MSEPLPLVLHRLGYERARIEFRGQVIVKASKDAEHNAARWLLAHGYTGMAETIDARTGTPCLKFDIEVFAETRMKETRQRMAHVVKYSPPPPSEGIAPCTVNGKDALKSSGGTQIAPDPTNPLGRGVVTVDPAGASA